MARTIGTRPWSPQTTGCLCPAALISTFAPVVHSFSGLQHLLYFTLILFLTYPYPALFSTTPEATRVRSLLTRVNVALDAWWLFPSSSIRTGSASFDDIIAVKRQQVSQQALTARQSSLETSESICFETRHTKSYFLLNWFNAFKEMCFPKGHNKWKYFFVLRLLCLAQKGDKKSNLEANWCRPVIILTLSSCKTCKKNNTSWEKTLKYSIFRNKMIWKNEKSCNRLSGKIT